jgi:hypothetical protein
VIIWSNPQAAESAGNGVRRAKLHVAEPGAGRRGGKHRRRRETCSCLAWTIFGSRRRFRRAIALLAVTVVGVCAILAVLFGTGGEVLTHFASALAALLANAGTARR